ncbi:hypothetical protein [Polaromonas sp. A23]|uniref:hypothetical protein n=1 Tax=Polaromonas sp. A23 TaxID=1944133 RepID=UPI0009879F68|nr:hypothetical protein [Polaromonas sp. A23]OOG46399.1 hypothetical protein B0B52_03345 [Polaromonas sp. A23]
MKLSFSTRTKRHTAFLVLLGWLFALASGVANACLLEARVTHAHAAPVELFEIAQAPFVSPGHAGVVAGHDDDSHVAKAPCLKACDDGGHSLPRQDLTADQVDPGPAPLVSILWTALTPVATSPRRFDDTQPVLPERPMRVRYSRLTL